MKTIRLIILFLLVLPVVSAAGETESPEPFRLQSVQADFRQEKHLEILARPLFSSGILIFQAPQSLRWEYLAPIHSLLLMHDGKVRKFTERNGRLQEESMGFDSMQVVLAEISNWLDGRFTDNRMFKVSFPDKKSVLLVPREEGLAALISRIELKLGEKKGLLDEVTIYEGPASYTRLTFSNRVLNREIPTSRFTQP